MPICWICLYIYHKQRVDLHINSLKEITVPPPRCKRFDFRVVWLLRIFSSTMYILFGRLDPHTHVVLTQLCLSHVWVKAYLMKDIQEKCFEHTKQEILPRTNWIIEMIYWIDIKWRRILNRLILLYMQTLLECLNGNFTMGILQSWTNKAAIFGLYLGRGSMEFQFWKYIHCFNFLLCH